MFPTLALYLAVGEGRLVLPIVIFGLAAWLIVAGRRRSDGGGILISLGVGLVLLIVVVTLGTILGFVPRGWVPLSPF